MSFPRYASYKPSGVEWLGEVPEGWTIARVADLYKETIEPGNDALPVLSVSIHDGVSDDEISPDEMERKVNRSEDRTKYKRVLPNDLVYNMMRAWQGGFGAVTVEGAVSPAYVVARPKHTLLSRFVEHVLRTSNAVEEMRRHSRGVTDFRLRLYWEEFKDIRVALPNIIEQRAIVAFLDRETAKIDALVDEQKRLIELLKEKRQAVISHAVTKGLDPTAPMKDSGIEWLGEVPKHWKVTPLKYLVKLRSGGTPSKDKREYWDGDIPWASAKDLKVEKLADTQDHLTTEALRDGAADLVPASAVLVLVRGMTLAHSFPSVQTLCPMAINQDLKAVMAGPKADPDYVAWLLRGSASESLSRVDEAGHGTKALRMDAWTSMRLPVPPLDEQRTIAATLETLTAEVDAMQDGCRNAIELLLERRAALISAAVTGKIDVRGIAQEKAEAA